jgi:hypothetical protein
MVVEDDLFSRNVAVNALQGKFKVFEISDGARVHNERPFSIKNLTNHDIP